MPNRGEPKMRESIRCAKFEIASVEGAEWKETTKRWFATMDLCRRASNLYYETWLAWHVGNGSSCKLEEWFVRRKEIGVKDAGKCPVECLPKELAKITYDTIKTRYPSIQINVVTLLMQSLFRTLSSGKAASGSLPKWSSILLHNEGMPMFTKREYPIPFALCNASLVCIGDDRQVHLKTWRMPVEGKATCVAVLDKITIRTAGKSCRDHATKFDKIASGEWQFKGSDLVYDSKRGKWFLLLCHQCPSHVATIDINQVAYLTPGRNVPFHIRCRGKRKQWLQGRGNHILATRDRVWRKRAEMNVGSRKTMTLRNGHGRNAASKWQERWSRVWRYFVKRVNHQVSHDAVEWCVTHGIGQLVYFKPNGKTSETRFVSGDYKNSTWEFFDLATKLAYKCQDRGVVLKIVECGKSSGPEQSETSAPLATPEVTDGNEVTTQSRKGAAKSNRKTNRKK